MPDLIIIDGHNVIHAVKRYLELKHTDMRTAIDGLIVDVINLAAWIDAQIIVVFDGRGAGSSERLTDRVTVVYSKGGQSADSVIERLVFDRSGQQDITVCTADYDQQKVVSRKGVRRMFPQGLVELMHEASEEGRDSLDADRPLRVEDQLPESVRQMLDRLRKNN